jgi:hypothetical protein
MPQIMPQNLAWLGLAWLGLAFKDQAKLLSFITVQLGKNPNLETINI